MQDLVEIEEWNEYGELKQHVTIIKDPNATPIKSAMLTPINTPSKAPVVLQENKKPESSSTPQTSKVIEPEKKPVTAPNAMSLALRQVGEEAAQKAKDIKKKGLVETFTGVGKAEPAKEAAETPKEVEKEKGVSKPDPLVLTKSKDDPAGSASSLQSPNSTAWRGSSSGIVPTTLTKSSHADGRSSLQSPTSTAWRPIDVDPPISQFRGSSISLASAEDIKKVEDEETIEEEDEESDSSEESSSEEEEEVKKPIPAVVKAKTAPPKEDSSSESSEEDSDDEEEDDEEEEKVQVKAPTKPIAKPKDDESSDSSSEEDDDEEDVKPPVKGLAVDKSKVAAKPVVKEEEEDTSEESESSGDEAPAKVVKA